MLQWPRFGRDEYHFERTTTLQPSPQQQRQQYWRYKLPPVRDLGQPAQVVLDKIVREILMREGVAPISAKGFYDHFANGENGQRVYDDVNFIRGIEIVSEIDKLIAANDDTVSRCS